MALSTLLVPCLLMAQGIVMGQQPAKSPAASKTRALDAAAATPFFTKRGADSVKKAIAGGDARKADESVLAPLDEKPGPLTPVPQNPASPPGQVPLNNVPNAPQQAQQEAPKFAWRLSGVCLGSKGGVAVFESGGKVVQVNPGDTLDPETTVVSVSRYAVELKFRGKEIEVSPW